MRRFRVIALLAWFGLFSSGACAATFTIANGDVAGLKNAIATANTNNQADTINLAAGGTYTLATVDNTTAGDGPNGLPIIADDVTGQDLTLNGNGATVRRSTASGTPNLRIFAIGSLATVTLGGLTIANGKVTGGGDFFGGGGIFSEGLLTIQHCTLTGNSAEAGGGIFNDHRVLKVQNCTFSSNSAGTGGGISNSGGGLGASGGATLTVQYSTLNDNSAYQGGAISSSGSNDGNASATVSNCTLNGNSATFGGGISNDGDEAGSASLTVSFCTLSGNSATGGGGGLYNSGGAGNDSNMNGGTANLTVSNSTISDNYGYYRGGGIDNSGGFAGIARLTLENSTLSGNHCDNFGGGVSNFGRLSGDATATVNNCTLSGNDSDFQAGGIYNVGDGVTLAVSNSTLSGNSAVDQGGGIYNAGRADTTLGNTLLKSGASGANLVNVAADSTTLTSQGYNLSNDNGGGFLNAPGDKINTDPKIGALANNGGPTETHALLAGSPALDKGKRFGSPLPTTDQRDHPRPYNDPAVANASGGDASDIGAYEAQGAWQSGPALVVNTNNDYDDGACTVNDCTLREAINLANSSLGAYHVTFSTTVFAAPGPHIITLGSTLPVLLDVTIIGPGASVLTVRRTMSSGAPEFRILETYPGGFATVFGLTISNGKASGSFPANSGGGVLNDRGYLTLSNCIVSYNSATSGGGIYNSHGTLTLNNCALTGNSAPTGLGGGIYSDGSSSGGSATLTVNNSTIGYNSAAIGGGIYSNGLSGSASATLTGCTIRNNSATSNGGGLFNNGANAAAGSGATMTVQNSTLSGNSATGNGGGLYNNGFNGSAGATLTACTLNNNSATSGGGVYNNGSGGSASLSVGNTILKTGTRGANLSNNAGTITSQGYNLSNDRTVFLNKATDQVDVEPLLGPLQNNGGPTQTHALLSGSPALDQGKSFGLGTDQRDHPRPYDDPSIANLKGGDGSDIGAYESSGLPQSGTTLVVNTTSDHDDGGTGACTFGDCTLREAINGANAQTGTNTITFSATVFKAPGPHTIHLNSALPALSDALIIQGPAAMLTVRRGTAIGTPRLRIFHVSNGTRAGPTVSLRDLTIAYGSLSDRSGAGGYGGGVFNDHGTLALRNCTLQGNSASVGGGLFNDHGTLTLSNCTLSANSSFNGGGLFNDGRTGGTARATLSNCTLSGNSGGVSGGIVNSGSGGSAILTLGNTLLAGTSGVNLTNNSGTVTSNGYNLSSDSGGGLLTKPTDQINANPVLGPLQNNGGPTPTHALRQGSPAIDRGKRDAVPSLAVTTDQRGKPRPYDDPALANASLGDGSDIGAYERRALTLSINDVTVTEGNGATQNATFTVTLAEASSQTVTVNYATANGTALAPGDYTAVASTALSFAPGEISKTVPVQVKGDTLDEVNETFKVTLSAPVNAAIADGQGIGTITDDDLPPTLSINDVTVTESNSGTLNAAFTVTLSAASGQTVTVNFATADGTATAPADYVAKSGSRTFLPGVTTSGIIVVVNGDTLDELNETFVVNLSAPVNATLADGQGQGTITDNDGAASPVQSPVALTGAEASVSSQSVQLTFSGALDAAAASDVTNYTVTVNGFVVASSDASYDAQTFTVTLLLPGGALNEGDEVSVAWRDLPASGGVTIMAR